MLGDDPLKCPVFHFPCEVWADECEDELGRDDVKARYRRQRIIEDITDRYPIIVSINDFIDSLASVKWFRPQPLEGTPESEWMVVRDKMTLSAASNAARNAASNAARGTAYDAAPTAARNAAYDAARGTAYDAASNAARNAAYDAAYDAAYNICEKNITDAAWDAAWDAAGYALALLVSDLNVDTIWLRRWWCAWEMGYYPLYEENGMLVAEIVT
jgi:hypothetical protein